MIGIGRREQCESKRFTKNYGEIMVYRKILLYVSKLHEKKCKYRKEMYIVNVIHIIKEKEESE